VPSLFRLLRYGAPPKVGTVCTVNATRSFLFTSGFMPELGTYPGPHVPQPFEVRCVGPEARIAAAQDVLNLTRMNWNTADIRGKWPVSLLFARRVGGILDECGDDDLVETSFRYFCVATGRRSLTAAAPQFRRTESYTALHCCRRQTNARARNRLLIEAPDSSGAAFGPASLSTPSLKC